MMCYELQGVPFRSRIVNRLFPGSIKKIHEEKPNSFKVRSQYSNHLTVEIFSTIKHSNTWPIASLFFYFFYFLFYLLFYLFIFYFYFFIFYFSSRCKKISQTSWQLVRKTEWIGCTFSRLSTCMRNRILAR